MRNGAIPPAILVAIALSFLPIWGVDAGEALRPKQLRFREDGQFKILQVADMHYADGLSTPCEDVLPSQRRGCSDLNTTAFVRRMIDAEKPDLVVFTGSFEQNVVLFGFLSNFWGD